MSIPSISPKTEAPKEPFALLPSSLVTYPHNGAFCHVVSRSTLIRIPGQNRADSVTLSSQ